jgi:hypothetical protein
MTRTGLSGERRVVRRFRLPDDRTGDIVVRGDGNMVLNQTARDWYTQAVGFNLSSTAICSTISVTTGSQSATPKTARIAWCKSTRLPGLKNR